MDDDTPLHLAIVDGAKMPATWQHMINLLLKHGANREAHYSVGKKLPYQLVRSHLPGAKELKATLNPANKLQLSPTQTKKPAANKTTPKPKQPKKATKAPAAKATTPPAKQKRAASPAKTAKEPSADIKPANRPAKRQRKRQEAIPKKVKPEQKAESSQSAESSRSSKRRAREPVEAAAEDTTDLYTSEASPKFARFPAPGTKVFQLLYASGAC